MQFTKKNNFFSGICPISAFYAWLKCQVRDEYLQNMYNIQHFFSLHAGCILDPPSYTGTGKWDLHFVNCAC